MSENCITGGGVGVAFFWAVFVKKSLLAMASFGRISFTICNVIYADEAYRHVCTFGLRYCSQVIEVFLILTIVAVVRDL